MDYQRIKKHIQAKLKEYNATFDIEQLNMVLTNYKKKNRTHEVVIYDDKYRDAYLSIHDDMNKYWTKDKVLNALDRFRIILAIVDNKVVGYIDITHKYDENEPYDIFVLEEYRNRGIATDMLSLAIELNGDKKLILSVDVTNEAAIHVYEKLGFEKTTGNSITAHLYL